MTVTDPNYPKCSALGILRRPHCDSQLTISTTEMHNRLGWNTYKKFLPMMEHEGYRLTPESAEAFLRTLNRKELTNGEA